MEPQDLFLMRPGVGLICSRFRERESTHNDEVTNGPSNASHLKFKVLWPLIQFLKHGYILCLLIRKFILSRLNNFIMKKIYG